MEMSQDNEPMFHLVAMGYDYHYSPIEPVMEDDEATKLVKDRFWLWMQERYRVTELHIVANFLCPKFRNSKLSKSALVASAESELKKLL